jgi:hypothetical protein
MFRKTRSRIAEDAFIPKPARIYAILHLCVAFTILCWIGSEPFTGDMLNNQRKNYLFQTVMGGGELIARTYADQPEVLERIERNKGRFLSLAAQEKDSLVQAYNDSQSAKRNITYLEKCKQSLERILFTTSPWLRTWLLLGLIATILLLKKSPGASYALCILPLVALFWWVEVAQIPKTVSAEEALYPSEGYLMTYYSDQPLSTRIQEQKMQLTDAWNRYLAAEWSPIEDSEDGEWHFQLKRLQLILADKKDREESPSGLLLCLLFIWSSGFAFIANRYSIHNVPVTKLGR